jgi:hypothetical protein
MDNQMFRLIDVLEKVIVKENYQMILLILLMILNFGILYFLYKIYYILFVDFLTNYKKILQVFLKLYTVLLILLNYLKIIGILILEEKCVIDWKKGG